MTTSELALLALTLGFAPVPAPAAGLAPGPSPAFAGVSPGLNALARDLLQELVETNSTHEFGSTRVAERLAARFRAAGFAAQDIVLLAPPGHPTKGNLVVRLRGSGARRPILYLGHLDVVEAKREDWGSDPFVLTEKDGWLYGRGTIDMKGQDAAMAAGLIELRRQHFMPARDIIMAFTADEEAGGDASGIKWLLESHRELIDAELVINPDGGEASVKNGRRLYLDVQTSEKLFLTLALEATDKGGHSSRPGSGNPIYRLGAALDKLAHLQFPVHLTETTRLYFARRAAIESGQGQADMRSVGNLSADPAVLERLSADVETNIMLRTTCTATMLEGGQSESALPEHARATIQCRVVPGESPDSVEAAIRAAIADPSIGIRTVTAAIPAPESPPRGELIAAVENITRSLWPGVVVLPEMSPGASDSAYTRAAGIPSYGIDAMFDDMDDWSAHRHDERIGVQVFHDEIEFTYRLMRLLAR